MNWERIQQIQHRAYNRWLEIWRVIVYNVYWRPKGFPSYTRAWFMVVIYGPIWQLWFDWKCKRIKPHQMPSWFYHINEEEKEDEF